MDWLNIEQAADSIKTDTATLKKYLDESEESNLSIEEKFASVGLLFSRERWQQGNSAYLRLIAKPTSSDREEPYQLSQCTIRIVITLLPPSSAERERDCIIAASTHEDLPIAKSLKFDELKPLPKAIVKLLKELKADLPSRKLHAEAKKFKAQKQSKQKSDSSTASRIDKESSQIKLF